MPGPSDTSAREVPSPTDHPPLSGGSARLRAVGVWALATIATLIVPAVVTAFFMQEDGLVMLIGVVVLVALFLVAPFAALAWALHVAVCAFVAARRHRAAVRASVVVDGAIGAVASLAIWTTLGVLAARAGDVSAPTMSDPVTLWIAGGAISWFVLLGAFNGWRLGLIARRRAGVSSAAATSPSQPSG